MLIQFFNVNPDVVNQARRMVSNALNSSASKVVFFEYRPDSVKVTNSKGEPIGAVMLIPDSNTSVSDTEIACNALAEAMPGYKLYMSMQPMQAIVLR